ncbi:M23 family metallopeptidase [Georgenia yuyongxinii]
MLAALAALTVVGLQGNQSRARAAVPVGPSVLDALGASGNQATPASLQAREGAVARATAAQASRSSERGELDDSVGTGANGIRAAVLPAPGRIVMPLARGTYRDTSRYGIRANPFGPGTQFHTGTDMAAPLGTPIYAVADGLVTYVGPGKVGRSSMIVTLEHEIDGRVYYTWYNHMFRSSIYVKEGQQLRAGDVVGGVGNNGRATGPNLHFEVHTDDRLTTTEPLAWLREHRAVDVSELV